MLAAFCIPSAKLLLIVLKMGIYIIWYFWENPLNVALTDFSTIYIYILVIYWLYIGILSPIFNTSTLRSHTYISSDDVQTVYLVFNLLKTTVYLVKVMDNDSYILYLHAVMKMNQ